MDNCFTPVPIPSRHCQHDVAQKVRWYSWSCASVRLIEKNLNRILALPRPGCISVRGCDPYSSSYSYRFSALPVPLADFSLEMADALLRTRAGRDMKFFAGMLDPPVSSLVLHKCFALIRAGVARIYGDGRAALHAPVQTRRVDDGFPLHSDLFLTDRLLLIFDDVSKGNSGKALFLSRESFDAAVKCNPQMPFVTRKKLRGLWRGPVRKDSFDESFNTIYSSDDPWAASLVHTMNKNCWQIKLHRGEGYLLNDRQWLHGRTPVNGRVSEARFRRLVYGPIAARR